MFYLNSSVILRIEVTNYERRVVATFFGFYTWFIYWGERVVFFWDCLLFLDLIVIRNFSLRSLIKLRSLINFWCFINFWCLTSFLCFNFWCFTSFACWHRLLPSSSTIRSASIIGFSTFLLHRWRFWFFLFLLFMNRIKLFYKCFLFICQRLLLRGKLLLLLGKLLLLLGNSVFLLLFQLIFFLC